MQPVKILAPWHANYWRELNPQPVQFSPPGEMDECEACMAFVTYEAGIAVVRVPWEPSDQDLVALASGGTVWLSTWGGLPPHMLEVQPAPGDGN